MEKCNWRILRQKWRIICGGLAIIHLLGFGMEIIKSGLVGRSGGGRITLILSKST